MKKGLVIIGVILLIVGLIMMLILWPMVGTIDGDELTEKQLKGESGTFKVVEEMSDSDWDSIKAAGMEELYKDQGIDGPGTYVAEVELKDGNLTDVPEWEKVPTMGGILGLVLLIIGVILLIVGLVTGRAAPMPPEQPPMEQPPMEPPMQGPPPP